MINKFQTSLLATCQLRQFKLLHHFVDSVIVLLHFLVGLSQKIFQKLLKVGMILRSVTVQMNVRMPVEKPSVRHRLGRVFALNLRQFSDGYFLFSSLGLAMMSIALRRSQQQRPNFLFLEIVA